MGLLLNRLSGDHPSINTIDRIIIFLGAMNEIHKRKWKSSHASCIYTRCTLTAKTYTYTIYQVIIIILLGHTLFTLETKSYVHVQYDGLFSP